MSTLFLPLREPLTKLGLLTPECFNELLVKFNIGHTACAKAALSKGLGFGIIAGSCLVKVPQILKILGAGSAEGLSLLGNLLELAAVTATGAYSYSQGFPFSSYGEAVFLSLQTSLIALLILFFSLGAAPSFVFAAVYAAIAYAVVAPGVVPAEWLWYGQAANIPMIIVGKMVQVIANFRQGHTGQLSAVTVFLLAVGALARIFTSLQETGDRMVVLTYVCSTAVNFLLALQVIWYWSATKKYLETAGKGKSSKAASAPTHSYNTRRKGKPKKE